MKLYILFFFILASDIAECEELVTNKTFPRSRYSFRNRKLGLTTEESLETTTLTPHLTTLGPMEVVVESQVLKITDTKQKKTEREVSGSLLDSGQVLKCGDRSNGDAPWIAAIEHKDPTGRDSRKTLSKGVLISSRHVLTTVSSMHNTHPFWVATRVRLGYFPTWMNENILRDRSKVVSVGIDKVYQHSSKDIAILQLNKTVNFGESIQPICLPVNSNYNHSELYLHICKRTRGHGQLHRSELISVRPLSLQDCSTMFHRKGAQFTDAEFCAWDEFGDTCTGDIGGPLMAKFYGKFMLVGLNSYAVTDKEFDASDYPGVYVNVGHHLKWIDDIISIKEY